MLLFIKKKIKIMVEAAVHIVFFLPPDSTDFSPLKKDFAILKKKDKIHL